MLNFIKYGLDVLKNKKGSAGGWIAGVIIALIIAAAIVISVYIFTSSQTHPFWEVQ